MAWILRLVKTGAEGDGQSTDVMEINKPDDLGDIATLSLSLAEARLLLAGVQREIVTAQARAHAVRRPDCRCSGGVCHAKDYRDHAIATLFGQVMVRLPRFRCRGRMIWRAFASEESARDFVRKGLRRRRSAVRRCGVAYRVIEATPAVLPFIAEAALEWEERRPQG